MNISDIIIYIMMFFMALGAIDYAVLNNKLKLGEKFKEGIGAMGALALSMVGIMCLTPVLGSVLTPIVTPIYNATGADPAMFAGTLLAIDMGGYTLAKFMTENVMIQQLSGIILSSMLGTTIVFTIPVFLGIIKKEDQPYFSKGVMAGIIAIPFGSLIGGLILGINIVEVFKNLIIVFILSFLLAIGLWLIPKALMKGFMVFSKIITIIITLAFACAIIDTFTGFTIIPGMAPVAPQIQVVGTIAMTLAGAYPLIAVLTKVSNKPLEAIGKVMGVNHVAVAGMIAALAHSIPTCGMIKDMNPRGKVVATAFSVPAAFMLGSHLGYTMDAESSVVVPMIVSKLISGFIAIAVALLFTQKEGKVHS